MDIDKEAVRRRVEALKGFPTLPGVIEKVTRLMDKPNITSTEVANAISADQSLSAKVLRLCNSSFYGFPGRISTMSQAVIILGSDVLRGIIVSSSVFDIMLAKGLYGLWEHSLGCAVTAGVIARKINQPNPEEISVAATLHDIGKVVIKIELPEESLVIEKASLEKQISIYDAEEETLGFNHSEAGNWLCQKWHLPRCISDPITYHHKPTLAQLTPKPTAIVHLADIITRGLGFGFAGDNLVPQIDQKAWKELDISFSLLENIICEADEKLEDTDIPSPKDSAEA